VVLRFYRFCGIGVFCGVDVLLFCSLEVLLLRFPGGGKIEEVFGGPLRSTNEESEESNALEFQLPDFANLWSLK
jgi:hypothetical protein